MPTHRRGALGTAMGAIYRLLNVAALTNVAAGGVHHGQATKNELRDYVVIQAPSGDDWSTMQSPGEEDVFQVAAVTLAGDYGPALAMLAIVMQLLDGERPAIANHLCVCLQWQHNETFRDPDLVNGLPAWRAVATFRMLVDQVS